MRILINGATGFLGKNLVEKLIEEQEEVILLTRNQKYARELFGEDIEIVEAEGENYPYIEGFEYKKIDVFVHFAWEGTSGELRADERVQMKNVECSVEAVNLAKRLGSKKFINAGSIMEYEAMEYILKDGCQSSAACIYSCSKLYADMLCRIKTSCYDMRYCNLLISNIYGEGEKSERFLNVLVRKMLVNETIELTSGKQMYDFIHVKDAVSAIYYVIKDGRDHEQYYIGNKKQRRLKEYIEAAKEILQSDSELKFGVIPNLTSEIDYEKLLTSKIYSDFGFEITIDFESGIKRLAESIREEWKLRDV